MATGSSDRFNLPYPTETNPVNVHGDIKQLVDKLEVVLPPLGVSYFEIQVKNISGSTIPAATPVYATGYTNKTTIALALPSTTKPILGLTKTELTNNSEGVVVVAGILEGINTSSFNHGDVLYVATGGGLTSTQPSGGSGAIGIVAHAASSLSNGIIIVEAKGNGTWGALKAGLA
jgi:hypothetical protein